MNITKIRLNESQAASVTIKNAAIDNITETKDSHSDFMLTPGLIDVHCHGIEKFSYEDPHQLIEASKIVGKFGVTAFLPTFVPDPQDKHLFKYLENLAAALQKIDKVNIPGFHIEGPFVGLPGAGCILADGDTALVADIVAAADNKVAAMALAPEVKNIIPVIEWLVEHKIVPFITHTKADVEQTVKAVDAGARHATHFYDVFYPPENTDGGVRPVGCVETMLADKRCTVDFICDGVHVHPMAIKATLAAKGYQNIILVTDSSMGAGLPQGIYQSPWGYKIKVAPGKGARIHQPQNPKHGCLAGSALTMDQGINNLLNWLDIPNQQVWAMGTSNPAKLLNLSNKGKIEKGFDADLVLWKKINNTYKPAATWVMGKCVYKDKNMNLNDIISE